MAARKHIPTKQRSFGSCIIARTKPNVGVGGKVPEVINMVLELEDVLKLILALQAGALKINTYKRSTTAGKGRGVTLSYKPGFRGSIDVLEGKI